MSSKPNTTPNTPTPTPAPTYFIHMPVASGSMKGTIQDPEYDAHASLLGHPKYAIYNPKRVYAHAKKSKSNCCCTLFALTCCFCCCIFFVASIVLGSIIGLYATQCARDKVSDNQVFSVSAHNVSHLVLNTFGDVTIIRASSNQPNITISVSRIARTQSDLDKFNATFDANNGTVTFSEVQGDSNFDFDNFWEVAALWCQSVSITVTLPSDNSTFGINVTSKNSDLTFNLAQRTVLPYLSFYTTNGAIELDHLDVVEGLEARSSNGHINLGTVSAKSITTVTSNAHIQYGTVSSNSITAQTTNANVEATQISLLGNATLSASTTNSQVSLEKITVQSASSIDLSSTNARITATLVGYTGSFDATTTNSDVDVSGSSTISYTTNSNKEKKGMVGVGSGSCTASTTNARVSLTFNKA